MLVVSQSSSTAMKVSKLSLLSVTHGKLFVLARIALLSTWAIVFASSPNYKLISSLHCVVSWQPRSQSTTHPLRHESRFATIFFLRPNKNATFEDEEVVTLTAEEWMKRKIENCRTSHVEQGLSTISIGKKILTGALDKKEEAGARAER